MVIVRKQEMLRLLLCSALLACLHGACADTRSMKEVFSWKAFDFQYPDAAAREAAIKSGEFKFENCNPLALEVWRDKVFVTVPRWRTGVPSSVNYVTYVEGAEKKSPALIPYPDLATNTLPKPGEEARSNGDGELPHKIISVYRVRVDACDRLWVMDSGISDLNGNRNVVGPAKLLVYDLKTDKLLRQHAFKPADVRDNSFFGNVVVDTTPETCDDAYAYVPDIKGFGLVVYSFRTDSSWRFAHNYFFPDPLSCDFNVAGINFQWTSGVVGVALSPLQEDGYRTVYFHPLSSTNLFKVSSRVLQNNTLAGSPKAYHEFKILGSRGPYTQASASSLDVNSGVLFYTQLNRNGLGCWNSVSNANDYSPNTNALPVSDNVTMISPTSVKVDQQSNVWLLSNREPIYENNSLDFDDVNYRIFKGSAGDIAKGTVCDFQSRSPSFSVHHAHGPDFPQHHHHHHTPTVIYSRKHIDEIPSHSYHASQPSPSYLRRNPQ